MEDATSKWKVKTELLGFFCHYLNRTAFDLVGDSFRGELQDAVVLPVIEAVVGGSWNTDSVTRKDFDVGAWKKRMVDESLQNVNEAEREYSQYDELYEQTSGKGVFRDNSVMGRFVGNVLQQAGVSEHDPGKRIQVFGTTIEVLTPDFLRKGNAFEKVLEASPDVFNHNIETVPSLYLTVRPGSRYYASIKLLESAKKIKSDIFTKSGLMVGLGENKDEILQVMDDLRTANVDFLTIGQYLQPSPKHHPLERYYKPHEFSELKNIALSKGFLLVASSPLTRSSYHADEDFKKLKRARDEQIKCQTLQ